MKCRDYKVEDMAACLEIFQSNVPEYFTPHEMSDVIGLLDDRLCPYLVVENDRGEILAAGGIWIEAADRCATLCWVMVGRRVHGQGLGRFVVLNLLNLLERFPFVTLVKLDTSQHAVGFYEKLGFEKYDYRENYYTENLHRYDMKLEWNDATFGKVLAKLRAFDITKAGKKET